ncbi:hypothetical protein ID866_4645 [Astraeus odoratus]|nr:hypothetical protein ID866_4645 [Astraeus odoratus]
MSSSAEAVSSPTAASPPSPPPIVHLLPLLRLVAIFAYRAISFVIKVLLAALSPLCFLWPMVLFLLSPITITLSIVLDAVILTPFAILYKVISTLFPLYVFVSVACITGAAVGVFGRYVIAIVLGVFARSKSLFHRKRSETPTPASDPLRRRRRKTVRIQ